MLAFCFFSGCARTEGYYKLSMREKAKYLQNAYNIQLAAEKAKELVSWLCTIQSLSIQRYEKMNSVSNMFSFQSPYTPFMGKGYKGL